MQVNCIKVHIIDVFQTFGERFVHRSKCKKEIKSLSSLKRERERERNTQIKLTVRSQRMQLKQLFVKTNWVFEDSCSRTDHS